MSGEGDFWFFVLRLLDACVGRGLLESIESAGSSFDLFEDLLMGAFLLEGLGSTLDPIDGSFEGSLVDCLLLDGMGWPFAPIDPFFEDLPLGLPSEDSSSPIDRFEDLLVAILSSDGLGLPSTSIDRFEDLLRVFAAGQFCLLLSSLISMRGARLCSC